jgi:hypothetical protein
MRGKAHRVLALVCVLASGCFGYNSSAKKWAYAGDTVLMLGGGAAIAADVLAKPEPSNNPSAPMTYEPPFGGGMVAGAILVTAGLIGIIVNATRPTVKTSR